MKWILGGLLITFLMAGCTTTSAVKDEEKAYLHSRMGMGHFQKGSFHRALGQYLEAEKADPTDETIQNQLGLTYFMLQKPQLAVSHFDKALQLKPSFTEAKNNKSRVWIEVGRFDEARALLLEVLKDLTYPHPEKARMNLGLLEFERGRFNAAREHFLTSLKLDRDNCLTYSYYARTLYELNEHRNAAPVFDRAVALCKNKPHSEPLFYSAMNLYKLGDVTRASARFHEVIELYPLGDHAKDATSMLQILKIR